METEKSISVILIFGLNMTLITMRKRLIEGIGNFSYKNVVCEPTSRSDVSLI